MMIMISKFKNASQFRDAFDGCWVELNDRKLIEPDQVTDQLLADRRIAAVFDPSFEAWYSVDECATAN